MAAESESTVNAQNVASANSTTMAADVKNSPTLSSAALAFNQLTKIQYGHIKLDISNSVVPLDKLSPTPSARDGLSDEVEMQIRSFGCELIQLAGKLLRLPQVLLYFSNLATCHYFGLKFGY